MVVDKVDEIADETNRVIFKTNEDLKNTKDLVKSKATYCETIILDSGTTEIRSPKIGAIYSVPARYGSDFESLTIYTEQWSSEKIGPTDDVELTVWFTGKTKLSVMFWGSEITNWLRTPQNIDLSNLNKDKYYRMQLLSAKASYNSRHPIYTITEYSDNQSWYDAELSETSTNAVQSKAVKEYVDNAVSNIDITVDSTISDTSENAVQNKVVKDYVDTAISQSITNTLNTAV